MISIQKKMHVFVSKLNTSIVDETSACRPQQFGNVQCGEFFGIYTVCSNRNFYCVTVENVLSNTMLRIVWLGLLSQPLIQCLIRVMLYGNNGCTQTMFGRQCRCSS